MFWWLWTNRDSDNDSGALITVNGSKVNVSKRLYIMGQYSRFIRPGWIRIDAGTEPVSGVFSSVYKNPSGNEIAIVIINNTNSDTNVTLDAGLYKFHELKVWRTSNTENLKLLGNQVIRDGKTNVRLTSRSITTLYGTVQQ